MMKYLPGSVKHLLAAAAVLQQSPELAAAEPLPYDAKLPQILQRSMAVQVSHNLTTADILSMPRNDLPALWAALWAAEECMGRMVAGTTKPSLRVHAYHVGGTARWHALLLKSKHSLLPDNLPCGMCHDGSSHISATLLLHTQAVQGGCNKR
jgi:hypothetical protein